MSHGVHYIFSCLKPSQVSTDSLCHSVTCLYPTFTTPFHLSVGNASLSSTQLFFSNLSIQMPQPSNAGNEDGRNVRARPSAENGWLVALFVFIIRVILVLVVALSQATIVIAKEKMPDAAFQPGSIFATALLDNTVFFSTDDENAPPADVRSQQTSASSKSSSDRPTPDVQAQPTPLDHTLSPLRYYVVFVGREVGYTKSRRVSQ